MSSVVIIDSVSFHHNVKPTLMANLVDDHSYIPSVSIVCTHFAVVKTLSFFNKKKKKDIVIIMLDVCGFLLLWESYSILRSME